jgi:hypothetical protein
LRCELASLETESARWLRCELASLETTCPGRVDLAQAVPESRDLSERIEHCPTTSRHTDSRDREIGALWRAAWAGAPVGAVALVHLHADAA